LLGGVSLQNEQTKIRGQSHVLLVGEPGTGKSVLLKEAANLAERSFLTNGIGTSSAGLSVSYVKDGSDWSIEPGALVLADNGVCCIDELTLLSKKDENSLL
jgi:DNA helicase MCM9